MRYRQRPGIVKTNICGVSYLIPTRKASEACPNVLKLSLISTVAWEAVAKQREADIYHIYGLLTKKPITEVHEIIDKLLHDLCDQGFLIEAEDETD